MKKTVIFGTLETSCFLILLLCCYAYSTQAQSDEPGAFILDENIYGSSSIEYLNEILLAEDGRLIIAGRSSSGLIEGWKSQTTRGSADFWVVNAEKNGDILWDKTYGSSGADILSDILLLEDGGYLLAGSSDSNAGHEKTEDRRGPVSNEDYWIVKIDEDGNKIWDRTYGGELDDYLASVVALPDGGFLLGGSSTSFASYDKSQDHHWEHDYWLVRTDAEGDILWDKIYGGKGENFTGDDYLTKILPLENNRFLLFGRSESDAGYEKSEESRGRYDFWVVMIDDAGNKIWDRTYGGTGDELPGDAIALDDGGFLLGGYSNSAPGGEKSAPAGAEGDYWVLRLNAEGEPLWDQTYRSDGLDYLAKLHQTSDGGFLAFGFSFGDASFEKTTANRGDEDGWVVRFDSTGRFLWDANLGGNDEDRLVSAIALSDQRFMLGFTSASDPGFEKTQEPRGRTDYWVADALFAAFDAGIDTSACSGSKATLSGKSSINDAAYRWEPAALVEDPDSLQTRTQELTETTTFTLTATLPDDSTLTDEITINIAEDQPRFRQVLKRDPFAGENNGLIVVSGTGGAPPYQYRMNDGAFAENRFFRGLAAGVYVAEIRDANGCAKVAEVQLK